jgi:hypothetical protein
MPSTYTLIKGETLSTAAATVTFSAIPSTYTDLLFRISARNTTGGNTVSDMWCRFNGITTNYSRTRIQGNGATTVSDRTASTSIDNFENALNGASSTANTFNSLEVYIPNYGVAAAKPHSGFSAMETNATTAYLVGTAQLWNNTAAISSVVWTSGSDDFAVGSSFYLYGISKT